MTILADGSLDVEDAHKTSQTAVNVAFGCSNGIAYVFDIVSVACNGARRRFGIAVRNAQLDVCARRVFVINVKMPSVRVGGYAGDFDVYDVEIEHMGTE